MAIERHHTNDRMSQMVIHGDTVYLAGQVALGAPGGTVAEQIQCSRCTQMIRMCHVTGDFHALFIAPKAETCRLLAS